MIAGLRSLSDPGGQHRQPARRRATRWWWSLRRKTHVGVDAAELAASIIAAGHQGRVTRRPTCEFPKFLVRRRQIEINDSIALVKRRGRAALANSPFTCSATASTLASSSCISHCLVAEVPCLCWVVFGGRSMHATTRVAGGRSPADVPRDPGLPYKQTTIVVSDGCRHQSQAPHRGHATAAQP